MGAIGGLFGLNGGASGSGFAGPQGVPLLSQVNQGQITQTTNANQDALAQQQNLVNALQGQGGIGNQSNVYNQLQGVVNGTGPNPAQAMLNQATGANVANQAALMAGQRGSSANAGLIARQAAQQGGALQQQAAGQGATMQANQSLNALNSAGNIANTQVANQIGATQGYTGAQQNEQANLFNAAGQSNQNVLQQQGDINKNNAALADRTMQGQQSQLGGLMNGVGAMFADGGGVAPMVGPKSNFGKFIKGVAPPAMSEQAAATPSGALQQGTSSLVQGLGRGIAGLLRPGPQAMATGPAMDVNPNFTTMAAQGGMVPAYVSPGEAYLPPEKAKEVVAKGENPLSKAKRIPGTPKYPGNDYRNDTVKTKLKEGGIVIPNSVMQSKDPAAESAKFVMAILAKRRAGGK